TLHHRPGTLPRRWHLYWGAPTCAPDSELRDERASNVSTLANEDPNRLVPLDTVRALERAGRVGRLHDVFYTTTGNGTPVASATRFGQEIAGELRDAGVQAVLLSGT